MTIRIAKPIFENRAMVSNSVVDQLKISCRNKPKFAIAPSSGEEAASAKIAVMGNRHTIVRKIAIPFPAIRGLIERMALSVSVNANTIQRKRRKKSVSICHALLKSSASRQAT